MKKKNYKEPLVRYADTNYAVNGERRDSPTLEKSRRKLMLIGLTDSRDVRVTALQNLLKDRNRLGDCLDVVSGNISTERYVKIHFVTKHSNMNQDLVTSSAWHLLKVVDADAEELACMIGCPMAQAEKAIFEIKWLNQ
jgi:hypothetical protein